MVLADLPPSVLIEILAATQDAWSIGNFACASRATAAIVAHIVDDVRRRLTASRKHTLQTFITTLRDTDLDCHQGAITRDMSYDDLTLSCIGDYVTETYRGNDHNLSKIFDQRRLQVALCRLIVPTDVASGVYFRIGFLTIFLSKHVLQLFDDGTGHADLMCFIKGILPIATYFVTMTTYFNTTVHAGDQRECFEIEVTWQPFDSSIDKTMRQDVVTLCHTRFSVTSGCRSVSSQLDVEGRLCGFSLIVEPACRVRQVVLSIGPHTFKVSGDACLARLDDTGPVPPNGYFVPLRRAVGWLLPETDTILVEFYTAVSCNTTIRLVYFMQNWLVHTKNFTCVGAALSTS